MRIKNYFINWSNKKKFFGLICIFFAAAFLLNYGWSSVMPNTIPKDFNFTFQYGVDGKNKLDTKNGLFTKDMGVNAPITTELQLTKVEMNEIYSEMVKINIASYSSHFGIFKSLRETPSETYTILICYKGNLKKITWRDGYDDKRKRAYDLRRVYQKIIDIIRNHEEYKELPRGGA